jgi:hypothetical protein
MIVWILFALTLLMCGILLFLLIRATKRLLQFDEIFSFLIDDIDINIKYFDKLAASDLLSNSPEVFEAHKNMRIMKQRLLEYVLRIGEARLLDEISNRHRDKVKHEPPVVV